MATTRVKEILARKGIMSKDLAKGVGMTEPGLCVMLSDKGNPTIGSLMKIADFLDVPLADLFTDPDKVTLHCPHCGKPISIKCEN